MSFNWINKQGVECTDGYVLQRMHRFYYHYKEGERVMVVYTESGVECTVIFLDGKAKWEPPHSSEKISHQKLDDIQSNIASALTFMKTPHVFKQK
jgi:hypothetical protein